MTEFSGQTNALIGSSWTSTGNTFEVTNRIYVQRSIAATFTSTLAVAVKQLIADPLLASTGKSPSASRRCRAKKGRDHHRWCDTRGTSVLNQPCLPTTYRSDWPPTSGPKTCLEYGIVRVNDGAPSTAQVPFGGIKQSGFGHEGGHWVLEEYLYVKYTSIALM